MMEVRGEGPARRMRTVVLFRGWTALLPMVALEASA